MTGSYSRAQVIVAFEGASTVTLELAVRPADAPILVNGAGFASSASVVVTVADQTVRETTTDGAGHDAQATLTVTDGHWP